MRNSLINTIDRYLKKCKKSDWIEDEAYKFQFVNFINNSINWEDQSDEEILEILKKSQKIKYTKSIGVQFIIKSGFDLKNFILIEDIQNFERFIMENQLKRLIGKKKE